MFKNIINRFIHIVVKRPWMTLLAVFLLFAAMAQYIIDVRPSVSYQDLLGKDHPKLIDYESIQSEYTRDDNLLVLVEAKDGNAFDSETAGSC